MFSTSSNEFLLATTAWHNQAFSNDQRMSSVMTKKRSTAGNRVYAVRTFERWLERQPCQDQRVIEVISPTELDSYLANFFRCVKNSGGKDYSSESFRILRANINSYLREKGYPVSITTSALFTESQNAFNIRKQKLKEKEQVSHRHLETVNPGQNRTQSGYEAQGFSTQRP